MHDERKYQGTKTHTLHIKDVEKNDKGVYQCLVKNDVQELSEKADLAVSELVIKLICSYHNFFFICGGVQFSLVMCFVFMYACLQKCVYL